MGSIFHIIKEELQRLKEAERAYAAAIKHEVQGSPQVKHIGKKDYLYLARRKGPRVVYRYIGNLQSDEAQRILNSVKQRREYQALHRGVQKDLKKVERALHGRKV